MKHTRLMTINPISTGLWKARVPGGGGGGGIHTAPRFIHLFVSL